MSSFSPQLQSFTIIGSGAVAGSNNFTVASFKDILGVNLTMASFGTIGYGTIEPNTTNEDAITFTGITQNSDGTATLTGVNSVGFITPYTASVGLRLSHAGSVTFIISNTGAFTANFGNKLNDEIITGFWQAPDPVATQGVATKNYVLSVVNGGQVTFDATVVSGTSDAALTAGQLVYYKTSSNTWALPDATSFAKGVGTILGINQATVGSSGLAITVCIAGIDKTQSGLVTGTKYYMSDTPGALSTTPGTISIFIGTAVSTTWISLETTDSPDVSTINNNKTYIADGGSANTYTMTLVPAIPAYKTGQIFTFKAANANTGASTLNINGLGAKTIVKNGASALIANDIASGQLVEVEYDGTNFQLLSPPAKAGWNLLGSTTLGGAALTISVTFASALDLYVMWSSAGAAGNTTPEIIQFNSDTGANYGYRYAINAAADTAVNADTSILISPFSNNIARSGYFVIENTLAKVKSMWGYVLDQTSAPNAPSRYYVDGVWNNTAAQITTITITATTNTFNTGTRLTVYGR